MYFISFPFAPLPIVLLLACAGSESAHVRHPTDHVQTEPPAVNEGIGRLEGWNITRTPVEDHVRSHGFGREEKKGDKNSSLRLGHKHTMNRRALNCPLRLKLLVNVSWQPGKQWPAVDNSWLPCSRAAVRQFAIDWNKANIKRPYQFACWAYLVYLTNVHVICALFPQCIKSLALHWFASPVQREEGARGERVGEGV